MLRGLVRSVIALATVALLAALAVAPASANEGDFVHGIVINFDGEDYYLDGAPDGPNGEVDVPGHSWLQTKPNLLFGLHFNTGPFGAPDGELLYFVQGIIDT